MPEPRIANTALTVFQVELRAELAPERLLDGPIMVEEDEAGATLVSTADPDAHAKLAAHPAVISVAPVGKAALIADWMGPETREELGYD